MFGMNFVVIQTSAAFAFSKSVSQILFKHLMASVFWSHFSESSKVTFEEKKIRSLTIPPPARCKAVRVIVEDVVTSGQRDQTDELVVEVRLLH